MFLYNIAIFIYTWLIKAASLSSPKAQLWCEGRKEIFKKMRAAIGDAEQIIWIHVASLGEFEQGRPIIERVKAEHPKYKILLTFFSPSGYEMRKSYKGADYIFYLPADTPRNAKKFLDIAKPEMAIFIKYEFWLNMLFELRSRAIKTYIVSAIFRNNSIFFKWWGYLWRRALRSFETIFVQENESQQLLNKIGFTNVVVAGDTRFDRVAEISKAAKQIPHLNKFKGDSLLVMAGSTWPADEKIIEPIATQHPNVKFLIAPHEIGEQHIQQVKEVFRAPAIRYTDIVSNSTSDAEREQLLKQAQVLILDTMGMLSSAYQYADISYIGGGFGAGIHNTLEAATFGLPITFGPKYAKFREAKELIALGASHSVTDAQELNDWITPLIHDTELRKEKSDAARTYCAKKCGATEIFIKRIFG